MARSPLVRWGTCSALSALLVVGACKRSAPVGTRATLVAVAELRGTTEPCGCNSDPLGDLARLVALARGGLLLDAGNALYDAGAAARIDQAHRKADTISATYAAIGAEAGLGALDLIGGATRVRPPRQACNVDLPAALVAPRVREVGGVRVGVFGVADPALAAASQVTVRDPAAAARAAIRALDADRAEVVVGLLTMRRADARALMQAVPGIDFGIIGADVEEGMPEPEPVGDGWLIAPADQGRRAVRIELERGDAPRGGRLRPARFDGETGKERALERLDRRRQSLEGQLQSFARDPGADPSFVAARKRELDELLAERTRLTVLRPAPPKGPYFTCSLVPIRQVLPRDAEVARRLQALARDNGRANLAAALKEPPPAVEPGRPTYVGSDACARCHKPAVAFWKGTRHAHAWETLVRVDKQYDYDCIGCHTTGWQAPGGVHMGTVEPRGLTDVQCEVCHGPGSAHVAEDGLDEPRTIRRAPAEDLCATRCHTKEHSDTFALDAYLRDVLGAGHGEARRKALGDGPTGAELRRQALRAAGR